MLFPEIGPEDGRDPDLRVGDLPEQEIGDPHLAARPDEQVGVREATPCIGRRANASSVRVIGIGRSVPEDRLYGVDDLRPAAVVQGKGDRHPAVIPRPGLHPLELAQDGPRNPALLPDDHQPEVVLAEDPAVLLQSNP